MDEKFYIYFRGNENTYHIEKLFKLNQHQLILSESLNYFDDDYDPAIKNIIITNDEYLTMQYLCAINEEDLKFLCNREFDQKHIRISGNYFPKLNSHFYDNFLKIKKKEIISYTFNTQKKINYPNYEFSFLETPKHYKKNNENSIFHYQYITEITLDELNDLFDIQLLHLGEDYYHIYLSSCTKNPNDYFWQFKNNDILRYFSKDNNISIYINIQKFKELKNLKVPTGKEINLLIHSTITDDFFIEYHIHDFDFVDKKDEDLNEVYTFEPYESNEEWIQSEFDDDDIDTVYGNLD